MSEVSHTEIESTVRYLGIEVDDALTISEQVDVLKYPIRADMLCSISNGRFVPILLKKSLSPDGRNF